MVYEVTCKTCDQYVEVGTIYQKHESNIHHAGCETCGWYRSTYDQITLGVIIAEFCQYREDQYEPNTSAGGREA